MGAGSKWIDDVVAAYGTACARKLSGPGDREAAIRSPINDLLIAAGKNLGLDVVPFDEVQDADRGVRPDYAVAIAGNIAGYVEVKRPGTPLDPSTFTGHNRTQWERQKDLPNLIYTNGLEWRRWHDGEPVGAPVVLSGGPLDVQGLHLSCGDDFEVMLTDFLRWQPAPITSVGRLVHAVAPLTRLLRSEVHDQLDIERNAILLGAEAASQPFTGLAGDWRSLLFPTADDAVFADGYAQAVTFALLLARTEEVPITGSVHEIGAALNAHHSLMGRALQILTDDVADGFRVTLNLLVRTIGAVDWARIRAGRRDTYLHLYEHFLEVYDNELRKQSGSYYTPHQVVEAMVRLTETVLVDRLGKTNGYADNGVTIVDPAMGTGTYLHSIIESVATRVEQQSGRGQRGARVSELAERLIGFELQMGPYAVAELRTSDLLRDLAAKLPADGLRLYVTDTLDDPHAEVRTLASALEPIAKSRRRANKVKADTHVTVVIGNPPYRERAEGLGGWIERGDPKSFSPAPLDEFRAPGNGRTEYVLKNLYVYFWRWATHKVFDDPADAAGVVCFISTAGYVRGPGFRGMREYLRRTAAEGWIIDVSPEGMRPDVATRIFPGVQQPLAIGIFYRRADTPHDVPARVRHTTISGRRHDKYAALQALTLDSDAWRDARTGWQQPFTPAAATDWDTMPALADLMPWVSPGVKPNRTWVYSPSREVLAKRWTVITTANDDAKIDLYKRAKPKDRARLLAELQRTPKPLAGADTVQHAVPFIAEAGAAPKPVRCMLRAFDRQWLIPDNRLINRDRPDLWAARSDRQVYLVEQHAEPIEDGPAVLFSALIPDMHAFNGRGGRTLPMLRPDGTPNAAPGLLSTLSRVYDRPVTIEDLVAYIACVTSHGEYTRTFADELRTPGVRVPLTADAEVWSDAVAIGAEIVGLQTFGERFAAPHVPVAYQQGDPRRITFDTPMTALPDSAVYDAETLTLRLGTGEWRPVREEVASYQVGGRNVIQSWVNYRSARPTGKKTSDLDDMHVEHWQADWTDELTEVLTVLTMLVEREQAQGEVLDRVSAGELLDSRHLASLGVDWSTPSLPQRQTQAELFDLD